MPPALLLVACQVLGINARFKQLFNLVSMASIVKVAGAQAAGMVIQLKRDDIQTPLERRPPSTHAWRGQMDAGDKKNFQRTTCKSFVSAAPEVFRTGESSYTQPHDAGCHAHRTLRQACGYPQPAGADGGCRQW